ncbi:Small nuclear ribonucleoprotein-associated protein B [Malassezia cuniculi]|uniref:Sm protein B n=1 Tax=Malassezia cuniculi TaxID=948313 RepID=A0AAF0EQX9_9BASI|nr:Small nuclear ribonucleoprotein-associated protein B [Malassezia cuniculi]
MPPVKAKGGRMMSLINYRLRITLNDGRQLTGQLLAFDTHMNLVLSNTEEFRRIKPKKASKPHKRQKVADGETAGGAAHPDEDEDDGQDAPLPPAQEQKRTLGLVILRGENIISLSVDAPPSEPRTTAAMAPGPGTAAPAARGAGLPGMPMGAPPGGPPPGFPPRPVGPPPGMPGGPPPGFRPLA